MRPNHNPVTVKDYFGTEVKPGDRIRKQGLGFSKGKTFWYLVVDVDHTTKTFTARKIRGEFRMVNWKLDGCEYKTGKFKISHLVRKHRADWSAKLLVDPVWRKNHVDTN